MEAVVAIAVEAGRIIESVRAAGIEASVKLDRSLVTRADREADAFLKDRLLALTPCGWLSEETADSPGRLDADRLWVVDPLDGTREFVQGLPEYAVAIALVERGAPVLGVVHNPSSGESYWAVRGDGGFRDGTRLRVLEGDLVLASRSELGKGEFAPFQGRWPLEPVGSIELKLALVAAGRAALTWSRGPKHEWDVCAGALLVAEAGGVATDVFGGVLAYNQRFPKVRGILAGAPAAHARALAALAEIGPSERMREFPDVAGR